MSKHMLFGCTKSSGWHICHGVKNKVLSLAISGSALWSLLRNEWQAVRVHLVTWELPGYSTYALLFQPKLLMTLWSMCKPLMMSLPLSWPKSYKAVVVHGQRGFFGGLSIEEKGLTLLSVYSMHPPSEGPEVLQEQESDFSFFLQ